MASMQQLIAAYDHRKGKSEFVEAAEGVGRRKWTALQVLIKAIEGKRNGR